MDDNTTNILNQSNDQPTLTPHTQDWQLYVPALAKQFLGRLIEECGLDICNDVLTWKADDLVSKDMQEGEFEIDDFAKATGANPLDIANQLVTIMPDVINKMTVKLAKNLKRTPTAKLIKKYRDTEKTLKRMAETEFKKDPARRHYLLNAARTASIAADDIQFGK